MGNRTSTAAAPKVRATSCKKPELIDNTNVSRRHSAATLELQRSRATDCAALKKQKTLDSSGMTPVMTSRKRAARSIPVEKLVQILTKLSGHKLLNPIQDEVIDKEVFKEVLFMYNREFADIFFDYIKRKNPNSKLASNLIASDALQTELEHLLEIKEDRKIIDYYLDMYSTGSQIKVTDFENLLIENYKVTKLARAVTKLPEGQSVDLTSTLVINATDRSQKAIGSVKEACFREHKSDTIENKACSEWLLKNCVQILNPLHQFCSFVVSIAYRYGPFDVVDSLSNDYLNHFTIQVPLLISASFEDRKYAVLDECLGWILSESLDKSIFSKLEPLVRNQKKKNNCDETASAESANVFDKKPKEAVTWTLLYNSSDHGLCLNRFMYHVLSYRGPTVTLISTASAKVFAIATASEWIESSTFHGSSHDYLYQIYPEFSLLEYGQKMLYLNGTLIGGVHGLKVGSSARKTQLIIDADFTKVSCGEDASDRLTAIETWGCGGRSAREKQLDLRAWTSTQIERQRAVKISADDWTQHPDRYLLNMAGRPQYNNK